MYRDQVERLTLKQVAARFPPRVFRKLRYVLVEAGGIRVRVELIDEESVGSFSGRRRWMRCPRCYRRTQVMGLVPDLSDDRGQPVLAGRQGDPDTLTWNESNGTV